MVEQKATRNKQLEDNVRAAELDFMVDLETLSEQTAADPDLIELNCCIEHNNFNQIPNEYKYVARKLTHRCGITLDDRIIVPKLLRYTALNALHFGHPGNNYSEKNNREVISLCLRGNLLCVYDVFSSHCSQIKMKPRI